MAHPRHFTPLLAALAVSALATLAGSPSAAHAQARLVSADPVPDSTINQPPAEVRLIFDRPLLDDPTRLQVTDQNGQEVQQGNGRIDPANRFALVAPLPVLFNGQYTVSYTAALVGSSTLLTGSYTFTLALPNPILSLVTPANGQAFAPGPVPVRLEVKYVDFHFYNTRVRLYVDGALYREWIGLRAIVDDLQPGVHELRTVLVQLNHQELPDTSTTVYIAIMRPDMEQANQTSTSASGPVGLPLPQVAALIALALFLFGAGVWLGHAVP